MNETSGVSALLDASVLYPALLRDVLLRLSLHGLFQARWSQLIQDEWLEALLRNRPDLRRDQVERTRRLMELHMPAASVTGFEPRIAELALPDENDRHVLAAAIHCRANVIVTLNLRDFPASSVTEFGLATLHPDAFIADLVRTNRDAAAEAIERLLGAFKKPPTTGAALLSALRRQGLNESAETIASLL